MDLGESIDRVTLAAVTKTINHAATIDEILVEIASLKRLLGEGGSKGEAALPQETMALAREVARAAWKRSRELLSEVNDLSEDINELMGRCEDLNEARLKAEAENAAKSSFLARVSHEIRTPLNAIVGLAAGARRDYGGPAALDRLREIERAGLSLLSIVNEILDFAKIASGKLTIANHPYETESLARDFWRIAKARLEARSIKFSFHADGRLPARLVGDEARVRQALLLTVARAARHARGALLASKLTGESAGEGQVLARLELFWEESLSEEELAGFFEEFSAAGVPGREGTEGVGLEASLARRLARAMGGDLTVENLPAGGASLVLTWLQGDGGGSLGAFAEEPESEGAPFTVPGWKILVVDDNAVNLKVAEAALAPYGARATLAGGGAEALARLRAERHELVFMDHMMPDMDGVETLRAIRAMGGASSRLPVIALTANAVAGAREFFLEAGFDGFLSKPIESAKLAKLLAEWAPPEKRAAARPASGAPGIVLPRIEGIDAPLGLARVGGDGEAYRAVLALFRRDAAKRLENLTEDLFRARPREFATHAHALKSGAANVGALGVSAEAALLEEAARRGNGAAVAQGLPSLREKLGALARAIEAFLAALERERRARGEGGAETRPAAVAPALDALQEALRAGLGPDADRAIEGLRAPAARGGGLGELLARVGDLILVADFAQAAGELERYRASGEGGEA
jgi:CheY-like chemotaxis protein/signal transduction histidine kinase